LDTGRAMTRPVLLLTRDDVATLMTPADYLSAVENAFRAAKENRASAPLPMHIHGKNGGFHAKGASIDGARNYVALKLNGNFPGNPERNGLPTIQGAILLCDADNGALLAILDSIEITLRRTAAASALAARHLASAESKALAIYGCGDQGRAQAEALAAVFPLSRAACFDMDANKATSFAAAMTGALGFPFDAVGSVADAAQAADIIVTCTTTRAPFLRLEHVKSGAFIAAVGADNPEKNEIDPGLMGAASVVADSIDQCVVMGDVHHALKAGAMTRGGIHAELADIVTGGKAGRTNDSGTFIFDSTGMALQDVASAALAYERAQERGRGQPFSFS
jgi:ornithine cyclodeaminase/alanine dehydrogenase-like protein (mu-crystallin family)